MSLSLTASLKYVEYINEKTNEVLFRYDFKKKEVVPEKEVLVAKSWIRVTGKMCTENGGKFEYGVCKGSWPVADKVCKAKGERTPTTQDFLTLITSCGGKVEPKGKTTYSTTAMIMRISSVSKENEANKEYEKCIEKKRLNLISDYWGENIGVPGDGYISPNAMASHINLAGAKVRYSGMSGDSVDLNGKAITCVK